MRHTTKLLVLAAAIVGAVGFAAAGWAYWTTSGSGSASASVGTVQPVTVAAFAGGDTPSSSLIPGGTADVILRVNNTNAFSVTLVNLGLKSGASITPRGGVGACSTSGVTFNPPATPSITLLPGSQLVHLAGAASMGTNSDSGCQGATFQIPVTITVQK